MSSMSGRTLLTELSIAAAFLLSLGYFGLFDPARLSKTWNIAVFISEMFPPDFSVLPEVTYGVLESALMAFSGTLLGGLLSLPLALLSSRRLFSGLVTAFFRVVLSAVRTVPAILWALIFVVGLGFGPLAGVFGLAMYTLGYLGKLYYESFDGVNVEVLDAVRGMGASRAQLMRYIILPESANYILSQLLFMFEYNVRASSIVGLVGAGGVGFFILSYIQSLQYDSLLTALLVILLFVIAIDVLSGKIRSRFLPP